MITTGRLIVDTLVANGIDRVFCIPGESYLGLLDALHARTDIDTVVCRHEGGAGFMALADARLSGRPGVAMVSRGPGASNAAIAVHTAQQDGVPFILIVGQVANQDARRDAFQEIDYAHMFGKVAKWTAEVRDPGAMAETLLRAIRVATSGVPGPVVLAIPEDILLAQCEGAPVLPQAPVAAAPSPEAVDQLRRLLSNAERPVVIAGSAISSQQQRDELLAFIEAWNIPALVSFRRQDLLPNAHRLYCGDMGLANPKSQMDVLRRCDVLLCLGARLSDITTQGYAFPRAVRPEMKLAHVHPDAGVLGIQFACDVAVACHPSEMIRALGAPGAAPPERADWISALKDEYRRIAAPRNLAAEDGVPFEEVVGLVGENLPDDAIVTVDAGTFGAPIYRRVPFRPTQRLLAPISGAMGFGIPAAVAAALRSPTRTVVCFVGDGGFQMTGNELAVARERKLPLKVFVSENGVYGSIRIHQERDFPGRVSGTSFENPDLDRLGRAYGFSVSHIRERSALDQIPTLLKAPGPQFIVVKSSLSAVLPKH